MNIKIELCLGSSCFARGNSIILSSLEKYIEQKGLKDSVDIIGHLCMNNCSNGPVIKINNEYFLNKNNKEIISIVESLLVATP